MCVDLLSAFLTQIRAKCLKVNVREKKTFFPANLRKIQQTEQKQPYPSSITLPRTLVHSKHTDILTLPV